MYFSSLRTTAFRNLVDAEVFTGAKDVFLIGENGQGKTNFLEALYFCAYASSFRSAHDSELAHNEFKNFSAEVKLSKSVNDEILVKFENGKKLIFINGKRAEDRKDLLSVAPCIVFCHEDMDFVNGSPEKRRWFFDQTLSLYDPVYLEDLRRYRKVLKTRNTILRDYSQQKGNPQEILDALDPQFASYGLKLMEKREKAAKEFSGVFSPLYEEVSGIGGITVRYIQSWKKQAAAKDSEGGTACNPTVEQILSHLKERQSHDIGAGISLSGPHRDRYQFSQITVSSAQAAAHNGIDFTLKASTGQRRLLALLLRTAQACRFSKETRQNPVLLLDDVLLEMDGEKRRKFITALPSYDQAFYTFLPDEPYQRYKKDDTLVYYVNEGKFSA